MELIKSIFLLEDTVLKVSIEAKNLVPEMSVIKNERKLLYELVLCILSSQEKYEIALAATKKLHDNDILKIPTTNFQFNQIADDIRQLFQENIDFQIDKKVYSRRLRFFTKKANYIIDTIQNIYLRGLSIQKLIGDNTNFEETRKNVINHTCGIGPKQASMFLRNIGYYSEYAVLDKHILNYMNLLGLLNIHTDSYTNISKYQEIEKKLRTYAEIRNVSLLHLDLAIWTTMRTIKYH